MKRKKLKFYQQAVNNKTNKCDDDIDDEDVTEKRRKYFSERSNYSPETRLEMQKVLEEINKEKENVGDVSVKEKKTRQLFMK